MGSYRRPRQLQQHVAQALIGVTVKPFTDHRQSEGSTLLQELVLPIGLASVRAL